jgi:aryl-alcohol dehydrogenase-like predicted oxidoreductase
MQLRPLGPSGINASTVAFGAWAIGGWMWGGADEAAAIRAIQAAVDSGMNLIDTAPAYGFGKSEEIVGKALKGRRGKAVIATKCGLVWHEAAGEFFFASSEKDIESSGAIRVHRALAPRLIRYEIEQSLRRLGVEAIDLYQTHWQDPTTPIADSMAELMTLRQEGKIRAIGCCNATPAQMDAYRAAGLLASAQDRYSMLDRKQEQANLPYCKKNGLAFLAYSPLAQGLLTGKIGPERTFETGDQRLRKQEFTVENRTRVAALLDAFKPIAAARGLTLAQLAIAWTLAQPGCTHALCGARTPEQVLENARAGDVTLTTDELKIMQKAIDAYRPPA